ncbi:hypothetical protein KC19_6G127900 [Ceratodon purpureus]|uniref:Uncharacterized protein n=1 Tax=Ceratodon purpureus TaxID=3225 RepID=A0A8T0HDW1_CERPU|nr:hypothetical protein KC19_6G127900 [Ceratodon purpureus]
MGRLISWEGDNKCQIEAEYVPKYYKGTGLFDFRWPIQIAAFLGRGAILEHILEHHVKFNSIHDHGFGNDKYDEYDESTPTIHCAALLGQVEAIQKILKYPIYDLNIQNWHGTALHLILKKTPCEAALKHFHTIALLHVLPNSQQYKRVKFGFHDSLWFKEDEGSRMFSAGELSSINLLLQAGIDIQTLHQYGYEPPTPGQNFNDEAKKWWYDKVVIEVATLKTSISSAANATSVIAALVATGSFIGPFQPPLGYANPGRLHTNQSKFGASILGMQ